MGVRTKQTSLLKTFADGANYTHPPANLSEQPRWNLEAYFIVTLSAVIKPLFTVAVVLTLAKPGAATVTV